MFNTVLIFAYGFYRTRFFTRYGYIDNCMIRTTFETLSATYTVLMINLRLTHLVEVDGVFWTVHIAHPCNASAAKICNLIVNLNAR